MNLRLLLSLALVSLLAVSCGGNGDEQTDEEVTEEPMPESGEQAPGMGQMPQGAADIEVSDDELEAFVALSQEVQEINAEIQQEMVTAVQEEGLDVQRFQEIQQSQMNPQAETTASEAEMEQFQAANERISELQQEAQTEMDELVAEKGISEQRLQEINMALQASPELQQRLREMMPAPAAPTQPAQ